MKKKTAKNHIPKRTLKKRRKKKRKATNPILNHNQMIRTFKITLNVKD